MRGNCTNGELVMGKQLVMVNDSYVTEVLL